MKHSSSTSTCKNITLKFFKLINNVTKNLKLWYLIAFKEIHYSSNRCNLDAPSLPSFKTSLQNLWTPSIIRTTTKHQSWNIISPQIKLSQHNMQQTKNKGKTNKNHCISFTHHPQLLAFCHILTLVVDGTLPLL